MIDFRVLHAAQCNSNLIITFKIANQCAPKALFTLVVFTKLFYFQCRGIDASIFQLGSKIHLTIGMMTLLSDSDVVKKFSSCFRFVLSKMMLCFGQISNFYLQRNASDFLSECYQELVRQECHIILLKFVIAQ